MTVTKYSIGILLLAVVAFAQAQPAWKKVREKIGGSESKTETAAAAPAAGESAEAASESAEPGPAISESVPASAAGVAGAPSTMGEADGEDASAGESGEVGEDGEVLDVVGLAGPEVNLGEEAEESGSKSLFQDPKFVKMLGESPTFIYDAAERPDPMVFPPVRNAAIAAELFEKAKQLAEQAGVGKKGRKEEDKPIDIVLVDQAIEILRRVIKLKDVRFTTDADIRIKELLAAKGDVNPEGAAPDKAEEVTLPGWIKSNTRAFVSLSSTPICLVGDEAVRIGEKVPNYDNVVVIGIDDEGVTYEVSGATKRITEKVSVEPYDTTGFWR